MATLFERLTNPPNDGQGGAEDKIPIHGFCALMLGVLDGDVTPLEARNAMALDAAQTTQAQALIAQLQGHARPREFVEWLFRQLVLAELGWLPEKYDSEQEFTARALAELGRNPAP